MTDPKYCSDDNLRDRLKELDESDDHEVTSWEAGFIETVVYNWSGDLSEKQRETALKILDKYDF